METIAPFYENVKANLNDIEAADKIKKLIDENGAGGWNALHFAIYLGHHLVVKDLLDRFTVQI